MAIDWKKELTKLRRIWWWWMKLGFIAIPFGVVYGCINLFLGHDSMTAAIICLAAALLAVYKIQGMPPSE